MFLARGEERVGGADPGTSTSTPLPDSAFALAPLLDPPKTHPHPSPGSPSSAHSSSGLSD